MGKKMTNCKACNKEIFSKAVICPFCGIKNTQRFYKRPVFWLIVIAITFLGIATTEPDDAEYAELGYEASLYQSEQASAPAPAPVPTESMGQRNALKKAQDYLNYSSFSKKGLIGQLEYEGFSNAEALYAVDNCGADWNQQAASKAESYISYTSFSRSGLIEQLEYEGFTYEQAVYGVNAVGY